MTERLTRLGIDETLIVYGTTYRILSVEFSPATQAYTVHLRDERRNRIVAIRVDRESLMGYYSVNIEDIVSQHVMLWEETEVRREISESRDTSMTTGQYIADSINFDMDALEREMPPRSPPTGGTSVKPPPKLDKPKKPKKIKVDRYKELFG